MTQLGKYEILEEIGRGGFAVVYKARDTTLDRLVALKVLHPQLTIDPKFVQRFQQEARTAASFRHPHIVTIYEVGEEEGQHYLAMALLSGRTLDRQLAEGLLSAEQAISIVAQIARALDVIHQKGFVHRDVKPGNIMVDASGQIMLLDFGIVRAAEGTRLTTTMAVLGTPEYMSPEQAEGEEPDARSDIYSLGVVAYQMFTGQAPFSAPSPLAVLRFHADKEPPLPRELNPGLSAGVEQVLLKALAKTREERYQSAGEMAGALRDAGEAKEKTPLREPKPAVRKPGKRLALSPDRAMPWRWMGGAGLAVLALIAIVYTLARGNGGAGGPVASPTDGGDTWSRPSDGMMMVYVSPGELEMGSSDEQVDYAVELCSTYYGGCTREMFADEHPPHIVEMANGFWMDKYEVSNSQYRLCVDAGGCEPPQEATSYARSVYYDNNAYDNYPVIWVNWHQAAAYCKWARARLPTEEEWEYAARGPEGWVFPWGDRFEGTRLNYCDINCEHSWADKTVNDAYNDTAPVDSFLEGASWCDALNMAGNVWEWTASDHEGGGKVLRGGAWDEGPSLVRSANRGKADPFADDYEQGFRCVKDAD